MNRILLILLIAAIFSCTRSQKFQLTGTIDSFPDNEIIYLQEIDTYKIIDSAIVKNSKFQFITKLDSTPIQVMLISKRQLMAVTENSIQQPTEYRFIWLENKPMTFSSKSNNYQYADIKGSDLESLSQQHLWMTDSLPIKKQFEKHKEFIAGHPESILSAYILSTYSTVWGKDETLRLFSILTTETKNSKYGNDISKYLELNQDPKIGEKFKDFEMEDVHGNLKRLSDFSGKTVLLEFWASNCGPCRKENPNLLKTYNSFKDKGFDVFAVSLDVEKDKWISAITADKLPWTQVSELNGKNNIASMIYGTKAIPDNFLIDSEGIIIERNLRGSALDEKLFELLN